MGSRITKAILNIRDIPQIKPVDPYPIIPAYQDSDGYLYNYTIYHLEQLTKL